MESRKIFEYIKEYVYLHTFLSRTKPWLNYDISHSTPMDHIAMNGEAMVGNPNLRASQIC